MFSSKKNDLIYWKVFYFILGRKYFLEVVKNLKIFCYLLIISNLIFSILIVIYFVLILFSILSFII